MLKTKSNGNPTRRPWYRLHLSTWLILPLAFAAVALVEVPGGVGRYPERPSWVTVPSSADGSPSDFQSAIVHGWPLPFLWRTPQGWTGDPEKATPYLPWKLTESVRDFRLFPLLADVGLAGVGLVLFAMLVELAARRRSRAIQFTLRELLVFAALVAIALGSWNHQRPSPTRSTRGTTQQAWRDDGSRLCAAIAALAADAGRGRKLVAAWPQRSERAV